MQSFLKKITEWILEKEEEAAKSCAIPLQEIEMQMKRVQKQKEKLQKDYDESMEVFNEIENKLEKIKNIETLRCEREK